MNKAAQFLTVMIVTMQVVAHMIIHFATGGSEEEQIAATNYYMLMDAICWTLAFGIIAMLVTGLFRQLAFILVVLWLGKVMDELFFDPCVLTWNDLVMFNVAQVYAVFVLTKNHLKKKQ